MTKIKYFIPVGIVLLGFLLFTVVAYGSRSFIASTQPTNQYIGFTFFSATTTSATSTNQSDGGNYFAIAGAKKVDVYFSRGGATSPNVGTSTFRVQVSPDGASWYDYSKLISNTTNTSSQTLTRVASVALGNDTGTGTSTTLVSLDIANDAFYAIRCIVLETTDGEHTCKATAEF